jgi:hypothetical protein
MGMVPWEGTNLRGRPSQSSAGVSVAPGPERFVVSAPRPDRARLVLLGGELFGEEIVMWWNFVGRSHEEIAEFREARGLGSDRFGQVEGYAGEPQRLPAPPMPACADQAPAEPAWPRRPDRLG